MPPKCKFTKEDILLAAFELTRLEGMEALTARRLAQALGTSTKPIFGLFPTMQEIQAQVINRANALYQRYLAEDMHSGKYPAYKASGMAYIRFAKEEPQLFKLLFMRDRRGEVIAENWEELLPILEVIQNNLHISREEAYLFHLEMWIYAHGIATMLATNYLPWDEEFISRAMTDVYTGMRQRYLEETP